LELRKALLNSYGSLYELPRSSERGRCPDIVSGFSRMPKAKAEYLPAFGPLAKASGDSLDPVIPARKATKPAARIIL